MPTIGRRPSAAAAAAAAATTRPADPQEIKRESNNKCIRGRMYSKSEYHQNQLITKLFVAIIVVAASVRPTSAGCESYNTCARCANVPACAWSVRDQTCGVGAGRPPAACPTFAVHRDTGPDGSTITVTVSNDSAGLVGVLAGSDVKCVLNAQRYDASVDAGRIVCRTPGATGDRRTVKFLWVVFGDKRLRFDDILDHYVTEYPADECRRDESSCDSCAWDDEQSVRFYFKRCPGRDGGPCAPYGYSDARAPPDYKRLKSDEIRRAVKATVVGDQCAGARIAGFRPDRAVRAGSTKVQIDVRRTLLEPGPYVDVTVAGRRCVDVTGASKTGTLWCTVTAADPGPIADVGPVEVTYYADGPSLNLTLRSARNFSFVDPPSIVAVLPDGGPATGGTELTVDGAFGIAGADGATDVRVFVAGDVACEISRPVRPDRLWCVTGRSEPRSGPVKIVFDGTAVLGPRFEYVPTPVLDGGQSWSGIASGGTELRVRGSGLSRAANVTLYVDDGRGGRRHGRCRAANDTYMTCRPPALDVGPSARPLPCGFVAHFAATEPVPFAEYAAGYRLHPDPVFADFEADGGCCDLTVNDANPGRGYEAGDVTVRLPSTAGGADGECATAGPAGSGQRVVCRLRQWPPSDPQTIVVAAGDSPARNVTRKKTRFFNNPFTAIVLPSVTIVVYVLFIAFLCVALAMLRTPKTYDLSALRKRSRRQKPTTALRPPRRPWRRRDGGGGGGGGGHSELARPISLEPYG